MSRGGAWRPMATINFDENGLMRSMIIVALSIGSFVILGLVFSDQSILGWMIATIWLTILLIGVYVLRLPYQIVEQPTWKDVQ